MEFWHITSLSASFLPVSLTRKTFVKFCQICESFSGNEMLFAFPTPYLLFTPHYLVTFVNSSPFLFLPISLVLVRILVVVAWRRREALLLPLLLLPWTRSASPLLLLPLPSPPSPPVVLLLRGAQRGEDLLPDRVPALARLGPGGPPHLLNITSLNYFTKSISASTLFLHRSASACNILRCLHQFKITLPHTICPNGWSQMWTLTRQIFRCPDLNFYLTMNFVNLSLG